jgi:hypothetical protein
MNRTATILLTCLALASCAPKTGGEARGDAATEAACRQHADQVYDVRNRGDIYSPQSGVNTPSSGSYAPGGDSRNLGQIFARDRMIRDCVRRGGVTDSAPTESPTGR